MTFLDLVRALSERTMSEQCNNDCTPFLHRMEAAMLLTILIEDPELRREIEAAAQRLGTRKALPEPVWIYGEDRP